MKIKMVLSLCCILCVVFASTAQKINSEKIFGGYKFTQNGKVLKLNQLAAKVSGNMEARKLMRSAKSKVGIGTVLSGAGGFLIGWPVGAAIGGGEPNWILAAAGVVLAAIGIPISSKGYNQAKKAVGIFNSSIEKPSGSNFKPQFKIATSPKGLGFAVRF